MSAAPSIPLPAVALRRVLPPGGELCLLERDGEGAATAGRAAGARSR